MEHNDIIIGLPAIVGDLWQFFVVSVEQRHAARPFGRDDYLCNHVDVLIEPWSRGPDELAPEELETPDPVQFEFAHSFLGKTRAEAIQEYHDLWIEHIHPDFVKHTPILELREGKAMQVFVPDSWEGIRGVQPLKINFKPDMPDRIKPKTRYINPRLYEAAEEEVKRLRGYFYEESRSPWASCLVMAPKATYIRLFVSVVTTSLSTDTLRRVTTLYLM
jgi:hypothetical protein